MRTFIPTLSLLLVLLNGTSFAQPEPLVVKGVYQGRDLYVKNPFATEGSGFCVLDVYVNGQMARDEVNSSAFAIDFSALNTKIGAPVVVKINHREGCNPVVLNPESILPHSTFILTDIKMVKNTLVWKAKNERGSLPYVVEQYRWNKWVKAGEIEGDGTLDQTTYRVELKPYHGENKVRIRQTDYTGKPRYSKPVSYDPGVAQVSFTPKRPEKTIRFSGATMYEIFDKFGTLTKTGFGKTIDVSDLNPGESYYLNYDNTFGETFRMK